ncbi:hypothetical protein [Pseudovibrio brasiliensis]|uniref:NADH-dependent butanol dehydrogenase A n=1 Tax=Pseudovibrio brasiliensis TaxID=1898042 RepID=A0ABX8AWR4_9HYPH|nr:hypothetical protein [Pseudovibrio brasiliensis]QUS59008.1 hypothetical protein KGB56_26290 [Pseudovibrio brasiliensis]
MSYEFNFQYSAPTQIHFGSEKFPLLETLIPRDKKVLILYGGGSIKLNGVYSSVTTALINHVSTEFGGISANPDGSVAKNVGGCDETSFNVGLVIS